MNGSGKYSILSSYPIISRVGHCLESQQLLVRLSDICDPLLALQSLETSCVFSQIAFHFACLEFSTAARHSELGGVVEELDGVKDGLDTVHVVYGVNSEGHNRIADSIAEVHVRRVAKQMDTTRCSQTWVVVL